MSTPVERAWRTMRHEAGHALVCTRLGVRVLEITANTASPHVSYEPLGDSRSDLEKLVMIALAGEVGLSLFDMSDELGARSDMHVARQTLGLLYGDERIDLPLSEVVDEHLDRYRELTRKLLLGDDYGAQLDACVRSIPTWGVMGTEEWEELFTRTCPGDVIDARSSYVDRDLARLVSR